MKRPWVWLVLIAVLLAICAYNLDAYHQGKCEERGGMWTLPKTGQGPVACYDGRGHRIR